MTACCYPHIRYGRHSAGRDSFYRIFQRAAGQVVEVYITVAGGCRNRPRIFSEEKEAEACITCEALKRLIGRIRRNFIGGLQLFCRRRLQCTARRL